MRNFVAYFFHRELYRRKTCLSYRSQWQRCHLEPSLLAGIVVLISYGFLILYTASGQDMAIMTRQAISVSFAFVGLFVCAQITPNQYKIWSPLVYILGLALLFIVLIMGTVGKGAQRWLELGFFRFQPSEIMKFAVPMGVAWYLSLQEFPVAPKHFLVAGALILVPTLLIAKQPDLGTAILVSFSGFVVLFFAGLSWRVMLGGVISLSVLGPILYQHLHTYQKERVLTFLNPERDPLGTGYHIIQSKIAVGSGGFLGKGLFHGSQSHLNFLPEHTTDFIFAVCGEELGFLGCCAVLLLVFWIMYRSFFIVRSAKEDFSRLLAFGLACSFFFSAFVNMGMVTGILPVVGIPLPLVSFGGTSLVSLLMGFGILMSIHTHRDMFKGIL